MTSRWGQALLVALLPILTACGMRTPPPLEPPGPGVGLQATNSIGTTGSIDANGETTILTLSDLTAASIQVTGTWTGTLEFETSADGTNWVSVDLTPSDSTTAVSTTTANGLWQGGVGGRQLRVRSTAWTTGTATVNLNAFPGSFGGSGGGGGGGGEVTNAGTFAVQEDGAALTALQLLDNAVSGSEFQVDVITMPSTAVTNAGTFAVQEDGAALTALQLLDDAIYTEAATDTTITGVATLIEGASNTLVVPVAGEGLVTSSTMRVSLATDDDGVASLGNIESDINTISTSLATDVTEDVAESGGDTGPLVMSVRRDTAAASSGTSGDFSTINTDSLGRLWVRPSMCDDPTRLATAVVNTASADETQLVALSGSTVVYVCGYVLTAEATVDAQLVSGTGTTCQTGQTAESANYAFSTTTGVLVAAGYPNGAMQTAAGGALCLNLGGAVQVNGEVYYVQE